MTPQGPETFAVVEADQIVRRDRLADRNRRSFLLNLLGCALRPLREFLIMDVCTAWISAGSSPTGRELLETNAATTSAASPIGFELLMIDFSDSGVSSGMLTPMVRREWGAKSGSSVQCNALSAQCAGGPRFMTLPIAPPAPRASPLCGPPTASGPSIA